MKSLLPLLALLFVTSSAADADPKPKDWHMIYGVKAKLGKAYHNRNSSESKEINSSVYTYGEILSVPVKPTEIKTEGKPVIVKSMISEMMIICKTGMGVTMAEYFFSEEMPSNSSRVMFFYNYTVADTITQYSKTSLVYTTLCPTYV